MILMVLCVVFGIVNTECPTGIYKFINITNVLEYPELRQTTADSFRNCGAECAGTPGCMSFGYRGATWECYLYDIRVWYGLGNKMENKSVSPVIHYWKVDERCSDDKWYTQSLNYCFQLFLTVAMPWNNAQAFCENKGGILYMLDTSEKRMVLTSMLESEVIYRKVCVGTTDENNQNTWNWFNGVQVTNFTVGKPAVQNEHCGMLQHKKELVSAPCTEQCHPVCEFPTPPNAR